MSRNLRNADHPAPNPASSYEIAPDFFNTPDSYDENAEYLAETHKDWKAAHPYKPGDVVWLAFDGEARRAYISDVYPGREIYGDRRAKYRVHMETKKGDKFARNWFYTWPGFIQRGYELATAAR